MPLLQATSPLTVRKDSTNPVTYIGISSRKKSIEVDINERQVEKGNDDTFHKLLQMKKPHEKEKHEKHGKSVDDKVKSSSSASTSSKVSTSSTKHEIISLIDDDDEDEKFKPHVDSDNDDEDEEKPNMKKKEGGSSKDSKIAEAPTFYPSEKDFQNPMKYIEEIRVKAASFGIAKIIPPKSFRPDCNVEDDMRFTAYNHYIHKMYQRWGTNVHETTTIKEYLRKSDVDMSSVPMIGGMEIDLSTLYHTVQFYGGLKNVIEKQKWQKVSDTMYIPKAVNDRASKLDSIYVKYVLPYEMLSDQERKKLMDQVEAKWKSRQEKMLKNRDKDNIELNDDEEDDPFEEVDECIIKGKSTSLGVYYRVARNTFSMLFHGKEPSPQEIEDDYWKMIEERTRHLCVYSGSIDCEGGGLGFPLKASSKHPWNLKVFATSPTSILKSMGNVMGATVPTLHVAMIYTTYCWYRDPQGLPWIEYLHSGASKVWYSVPGSHENMFRKALTELQPLQCKNKKIWLQSDSVMVPPELLIEKGVPLARVVQNPGEFLVVFPKAFTSAICTGYLVSESVCFASPAWLNTCLSTFRDIRESKEPPVFPVEKLLLSILMDSKVSLDVLKLAMPLMEILFQEEFSSRKKLLSMGISTGKMCPESTATKGKSKKKSKKRKEEEEEQVHQCDVCNYILHLSVVMVTKKNEQLEYCLTHATQRLIKSKAQLKNAKLLFDYSQDELEKIVSDVRKRLDSK